MDKALLQLLQQSLDVLTMAVNQNQHDMLMTGEECRKCESAIEALQAATAKPTATHITWNAAGVRTVNGVPDYVAQPEQPQPDLRAILKDVVSVAIAQLYEQHTDDTLAEFPLKDLEVIVENTDPLRPQSVEKIYRRGFDAIYNAETAQPVPPATDIHSCSYYCERPACVKKQRDELRDAMLNGLQKGSTLKVTP